MKTERVYQGNEAYRVIEIKKRKEKRLKNDSFSF